MNIPSHDFVFFDRRHAAVLLTLICLVFTAASCRTGKVTVEVPVYIHDTTYVSSHIHDSVYIETTEYIKGDTVYKTKWKYVERVKTDTLVKYVEKPVEVYNEVVTTKYIEKELCWWQKSLMFLGCIMIFGMLVYTVALIVATRKT